MAKSQTMADTDLDAVVIGGGFAGLFMVYRLSALGMNVVAYEAGSGIGGTWFWNRYPGARCDIESLEYSYQFSEELQQEWEWSERFASQPEILKYAEHVADRFDLRKHFEFNTRVDAATFDEESNRWTIKTDKGDEVTAKYCVMATGCLSSRNVPDFPGLNDFAGSWHHTGAWPHEGVGFAGKRVAVIGTGSSAIQSIPIIAEQAKQLTVFQRTANYSVPAHNAPLDPDKVREIKAEYPAFRERNSQMPFGAGFSPNEAAALDSTTQECQAEYQRRWDEGGLGFMSAFSDLLAVQEANDSAIQFFHGKIRNLVDDPDTATLLCPSQTVGCKRLCVDTNYFETYNRANVELVDVSDSPIKTITKNGLTVADKHYDFDVIILATGFDALTGALLSINIKGRDGLTLAEKWAEGPRTFLGLGTVGFPNLFIITGPGSPSVLSNMLPSIEQHVNWIADCIEHLETHQKSSIEATLDAENNWGEHVNELASQTLFPTCNSWYLGANVPGKPRVFMPYLGFPPYVEKCNEVAAAGYEGFKVN